MSASDECLLFLLTEKSQIPIQKQTKNNLSEIFFLDVKIRLKSSPEHQKDAFVMSFCTANYNTVGMIPIGTAAL